MAKPRREPTTDEEARELRTYLERGAKTDIEVKRRIAPVGPVALELAGVRSLAFSSTTEELATLVGADDEDQVILDIEIDGVTDSGQSPVFVYLTEEAARKNAGADDPAFVGAVAFFVGTHDAAAHAQPAKQRVRLNATHAVRKAKGLRGPLTVGFVPTESRARPVASKARVTAATFEVVRSTVEERS